jgi:hypothetical protein
MEASGAVFEEGQRVQALTERGVDVEEVRRDDALGLGGKELPPGRTAAAGAGSTPAACKIRQTVEGAIR